MRLFGRFRRHDSAAIILPVLRQVPGYLERSVRSAIDQTVRGEVIVVTSPETPEPERAVLAAAQRRRRGDRLRVIEQTRPGFAAAINEGIAQTEALRVGLLLSDDWLDRSALEASLAHDADIVSGGKTPWQADGRARIPGLNGLRTAEGYRRATTDHDRAVYLTHFLLFRRSAVLAVGGLDETIGDLAGVDDLDLPWSLLEQGARVAFVGRSLYHYRDHGGERLTLRAREESIACLERILAKHRVPEEERPALLARHARWYGRTIEEVAQSAP
ncbi:MAG: glycosyltransferase family A protein [Chloroflexota bacterium]